MRTGVALKAGMNSDDLGMNGITSSSVHDRGSHHALTV